CLPRARHRPPRFRDRARGLSPLRRTIMTSKAEMIGAALGKAVRKAAEELKKPTPAKEEAKATNMYRTNLRTVPKVDGLRRDDGWGGGEGGGRGGGGGGGGRGGAFPEQKKRRRRRPGGGRARPKAGPPPRKSPPPQLR